MVKVPLPGGTAPVFANSGPGHFAHTGAYKTYPCTYSVCDVTTLNTTVST